MTEPRNKGGAPKGNRNNLVHGGRSGNPALVVGFWGANNRHAVRGTLAFRRWLWGQVEQAHKTVGPGHVGNIQRATTANMAQRVLRGILARAKPDELSATAEADLVARIMHYSSEEMRAVSKLNLDAKPASEWAEIDAMTVADMGQDVDQDEDGSEDDPGDATHANGVLGDAEGDRRNPTEFWAEADRLIAGDDDGDLATPGAD